MQNNKLDRIDIRILAELQGNGRIKNVDLARNVTCCPVSAYSGSSGWRSWALAQLSDQDL